MRRPVSQSVSQSAVRLCLLGNSHLACLKLAAVQDPALLPGKGDVNWFAGSSDTLNSLRLEKGRYFAPRGERLRAQMKAISGGEKQIDIKAYDLFVIMGVALEFRTIFTFFRSHCLPQDVEKGHQAGRSPVSASFFRAFLADVYAQRPATRLTRQIQMINPDARVVIMPAPYPSETILDHRKASGVLADFKGSDTFSGMTEIYLAAARRAAEAAGALLVPQGPETLAAPGFTKAGFNLQAIGLQSPSQADAGNWYGEKTVYDPWHMNAEFGRQRLLDLAGAIQERSLVPTA